MTQIPSIEKTEDLIIRERLEKGTPDLYEKGPHGLYMRFYTDPSIALDCPPEKLAALHSLDITVHRDERRVRDVELRMFRYHPGESFGAIDLELWDSANIIAEHEYIVTLILRFLRVESSERSPTVRVA